MSQFINLTGKRIRLYNDDFDGDTLICNKCGEKTLHAVSYAYSDGLYCTNCEIKYSDEEIFNQERIKIDKGELNFEYYYNKSFKRNIIIFAGADQSSTQMFTSSRYARYVNYYQCNLLTVAHNNKIWIGDEIKFLNYLDSILSILDKYFISHGESIFIGFSNGGDMLTYALEYFPVGLGIYVSGFTITSIAEIDNLNIFNTLLPTRKILIVDNIQDINKDGTHHINFHESSNYMYDKLKKDNMNVDMIKVDSSHTLHKSRLEVFNYIKNNIWMIN